MTDRQLTFETNDIAHLVKRAYGKLRVGAFGDAAKLLECALELDVEYEGITATLKSVRFWGERRRRLEDLEECDRAAYLLDQWAALRGFAARIEDLPERCYQDIKFRVHAMAVEYLRADGAEHSRIAGDDRYRRPRPETRRLLRLGHAYKAMGDFVNAITNLEQASKLDGDWAPLLAELADCYSLIGENRAAQVFFREAFYLGAAEIPLDRDALLPGLLNRYFWLIEHYRCTREEQSKIADVLRRVQALDAGIHQKYVA